MMGELPSAQQKAAFERELTMHTLVHEQLIQFFKGFKHDAHPMAIMVGIVGALSAFEPYSADLACAPESAWISVLACPFKLTIACCNFPLQDVLRLQGSLLHIDHPLLMLTGSSTPVHSSCDFWGSSSA